LCSTQNIFYWKLNSFTARPIFACAIFCLILLKAQILPNILVKILSDNKTYWIRFTRRFIRIQAVCLGHFVRGNVVDIPINRLKPPVMILTMLTVHRRYTYLYLHFVFFSVIFSTMRSLVINVVSPAFLISKTTNCDKKKFDSLFAKSFGSLSCNLSCIILQCISSTAWCPTLVMSVSNDTRSKYTCSYCVATLVYFKCV